MKRQLTLAHLVIGLMTVIVGGAATAGAAWSTVQSKLAEGERRQEKIEAAVMLAIPEIRERLVRIETKLDSREGEKR